MELLILFFYIVPLAAMALVKVEVEFKEGKNYHPLFVKAVYFALCICPVVNLILFIRLLTGGEIKVL